MSDGSRPESGETMSSESSTIHDEQLSTSVAVDKKHLKPASQKNGEMCPFFFSPCGCNYGDKCEYQYFTHPTTDNPRGSPLLNFSGTLEASQRRQRQFGDDLPEPMFPSKVIMDMKACFINRATEAILRKIAKSERVTLCIKDHKSNDCLKSVEVMGKYSQVKKACRRISSFESHDQRYCRLRSRTKLTSTMESSSTIYRECSSFCGQNIFRMLVPKEVDFGVCARELEAKSTAYISLVEGKSQNIAMVYAEEQQSDCDLSPAAFGVLCLFHHFFSSQRINVKDNLSAKLLVNRDQLSQFFREGADTIETKFNCTFAVHEADDIGLLSDLVLEIVGESHNLILAFEESLIFFQQFSVHKSMIPLLEVLMDMENVPVEMSLDSHVSSETFYKVIIEYDVDAYHVATALVGEDGNIMRKLRDDSRAIINIEQMMRDHRRIMIYISGNEKEVFKADDLIKNLLNEASMRENRTLNAYRSTYLEKS